MTNNFKNGWSILFRAIKIPFYLIFGGLIWATSIIVTVWDINKGTQN